MRVRLIKEFFSRALAYAFAGGILAQIVGLFLVVIRDLATMIIDVFGGLHEADIFLPLFGIIVGIVVAGVQTWREGH